MARPKGAINRNKRSRKSENRDAETYSYSDSGCRKATEYMGRQSMCLECTFGECKEKIRDDRKLDLTTVSK